MQIKNLYDVFQNLTWKIDLGMYIARRSKNWMQDTNQSSPSSCKEMFSGEPLGLVLDLI